MILAALSSVFSILGPRILAQATNEIFTGIMNMVAGSTVGINFTRVGQILLLLLGLYLISSHSSRALYRQVYRPRYHIISKTP